MEIIENKKKITIKKTTTTTTRRTRRTRRTKIIK
jgi:hypothetical protein